MLNNFLSVVTDTPLFGISVCILFYALGTWIREKTKLVIFNPLLIATLLIAVFLKLTSLPFEKISSGAEFINLFLSPLTACLGLAIYNQRETLKKNLLPVIAGTLSGSIASVATVYTLCKLLNLEEHILNSILAKSVTMPIALALSSARKGIAAVTVLSVVVTGITGGILSPKLVKLFKIKSEVASGIAIGTSSHAVGTASALQMGEVYGAMSSVAIGCAGIATTLIFIFIR